MNAEHVPGPECPAIQGSGVTLSPTSWVTSIDHSKIDAALARALDEVDGDVTAVDAALLGAHLTARGYSWGISDHPDDAARTLVRAALAAATLPSGYVRPALFAEEVHRRGVPLVRRARDWDTQA